MKRIIFILTAALSVGGVSAHSNMAKADGLKDTTLYTTSQYKVPRNGNAVQLLLAIRDFSVDANGALMHNDQFVKTISINGKRYGGLGVDSVIKTMPAELVQNVELIDSYGYKDAMRVSAGYSGDPNKQLNINTKPNKSYQLYEVLAALHVKPFEELVAMRRGPGSGGRGNDAAFFAPAQRMLSSYYNNFYEIDDYGDQIPHFLIKPKPGEYTPLSFERNAWINLSKQTALTPSQPGAKASGLPVIKNDKK